MATTRDSAPAAPGAPDTGAATPLDARYRLLFESNPAPLGVMSIATQRYLIVNAAAERVFGYGPGEMVGVDAALVIDERAHQTLVDAIGTHSADFHHVGTVPMRRKDRQLI